ncbi:MAG: InlB B-repeat-containing protein, partial [Bacteroides sp.]|nr:InlB B-repeat-containing protein [Bacteroides sp.]
MCGAVGFGIYKGVNKDTGSGGSGGIETVTFVLNNGEEDIVCGIGEGLPAPNKTGYYLYGWYTDVGLSERIEITSIADVISEANAGKFASGECKIYARWEKLKEMTGVRITDTFFIYDGNSHEPEIEGLPSGASVEYDGKYVDAGEYDVTATVSAYGYKDKVIEGKFTIRKAIADVAGIRFEDKTSKWDGTKKYIEILGDLPIGVSVSYENNGQTDIGTYKVIAKFACGRNYESIADMEATLTISPETYNITLVEEDRTSRTIEVNCGSSAEELPKPKDKRGYVGSWDIADLEGVREDITVYAKYELARYEIEYEKNGGVVEEDCVTEYTIKETVTLKDATREYYNFCGWYESADYDGERVYEIALDSVGNRKYYAKWEEIEYRVKYELDKGQNNKENVNSGDEYAYTVNSADLILQEPTKLGYRFLGWKDKGGKEVTKIESEKPSTYTLYAAWEIIRYGITYELYGGLNGEGNPSGYTVESGEIELATPSKEKHRFLGWYKNEKFLGDKVESIQCGECVDITLYARWERIVFEVESDAEGDNIITAYDYAPEDWLVIPASIDGKKISGIKAGVLKDAVKVELRGFEKINGDAFAGCTKLKELILPSTLNKLPAGLLADCVSLQKLTLPYASNMRIAGNTEYDPLCTLFGIEEKPNFYAAPVSIASKTSANDISVYDTDEVRYVPNALERITLLDGDIAPSALLGLTSVKEVRIVGKGGRIGVKAMGECTSLERVILGEGTVEVNQNAFYN